MGQLQTMVQELIEENKEMDSKLKEYEDRE